LEIAYTSELRGNLLPCFCPKEPFGGLARRIGWVDSLRQNTTGELLVLDGGSALPEREQYPLLSRGFRTSLLKLHLEALEAIGYDALLATPGAAVQDVAAKDSEVPWVAPNQVVKIERGWLTVLVLGIDENHELDEAVAAVTSAGPADLTVLLCSGDYHFASAALERIDAAVVIVGRGACFHQPARHKGSLLLGPCREGKYVGWVRIEVTPGETAKLLDHRLRAMDATVPAPSAWRERVEGIVLEIERNQPGALFFSE
jgi:hypothetical protein